MAITYLTGVSTPMTRASERDDLGVLATPASGVYRYRDQYPAWAADNACFSAPLPDGDAWADPVLGGPASPTARAVRYEPTTKHVARWLRWLETLDPDGCLFVTLPDVVGDYAATWELSAQYVTRVRALGFPVAIVLQDGVENDPFVWQSILNGADAVFIGGSTEWKLGPAVEKLVAEAKARGLFVHMGRVNSRKRLRYAEAIGCDTADGTYIGFAPTVNFPKVEGWLDAVNDPPAVQLALAA